MADGSWVGITNVHLPQELTCFQIPAVGKNTNSDTFLITVTPLCRTDMGLVPRTKPIARKGVVRMIQKQWNSSSTVPSLAG